jgi:hypothetical protein
MFKRAVQDFIFFEVALLSSFEISGTMEKLACQRMIINAQDADIVLNGSRV